MISAAAQETALGLSLLCHRGSVPLSRCLWVTHSPRAALGRKETALSLGPQEKEEKARGKEVHPESGMGAAAQGSPLSLAGFSGQAAFRGF